MSDWFLLIAGLLELAGIKNLKTVFLWHSQVIPAGAANLKKAPSALEITMGSEELLTTQLPNTKSANRNEFKTK